ncbi:MAG: GTPase HflX [Endomicrobiales bacterium]|nr:GTPase HflX [Endomicrobiales bacterium]
MEKALLVGLHLPRLKRKELDNSISELERLTKTAGATPEQTIIQKRDSIDPAYLIGQGKAFEIKEIARTNKIDTIIFDEDLKPVQQRNLQEIIEKKIIGRTRLILDIFAQRAHTKEGKLQIELAQLNYLLPRITERYGRFEQQIGGIGTRGPGERKLEYEKRGIRDRIAHLNREIESIRMHRDIARSKRIESGHPTVAIVGYTNSGKSTLLNALTKSNSVYADDKFFATLDPTTRQVRLPGGREILFTDTVGFIRKLPHMLVAAFRATLEEVTSSHCILHLIDISQPDHLNQMQTTLNVLKELKADHIPIVPAYNKADLIPKDQRNKLVRKGLLLVSSRTGEGINKLLQRIEQIIIPKLNLHRLTLPYEKSRYLAKIFGLGLIKKQSYTDKGIKIQIRSSSEQWEKIKSLIK